MTQNKKTDRSEVIQALQARGPFTKEEKPLVVITGPAAPSSEEAGRLAASPWVPHSAEQLYEAALDTFRRALGSHVPSKIPQLLEEVKYKMEGAEHHLRKVGQGSGSEWWEAEAFLTQARGTLDILARIVSSVAPNVPQSFERDGRPIANALRNQPRHSRHYESSIELANLIEEERLIRELSAVRNEVHHRGSLPTLAKVKTGTVHLAGLNLEEFCIQKWLALMQFVRHFLEWVISIAWEIQRDD